ncbi:MAG TPA: hypothetical protein VGF55_02075 [Gemmataceae bacterium]|jgi:hypothetical protein
MRIATCGFLGGLLLAIGCAKSLPPVAKPVPVKGRVVLADGRPLTGGVVTFRPTGDDLAGRYQGWGFVKPDGSFEVAAFSDATKGGGVAPGRYKVVIGPRDEGEPRGSNARLIPKRYTDDASTPLEVEIQPEDNVLQPFVLK